MRELPLEIKIEKTKLRIREWYEYWNGDVYISFSGGKDSTVLLDIVRQIYPKIPAVFIDTGLEYPEIKDFVKSKNDIIWLRPKLNFKDIIEKHGYPVISKRVSRYIKDLQNPTEKNISTRNLRLTGYSKNGTYYSSLKLPNKWLFLIDAPFKLSDICCDYMKKEPFKRYEKENGRHGINGVMASDSRRREEQYLNNGCNAFKLKNPISQPLGFWTEQDILTYIKEYNIPYASVYGDITKNEKDNELTTTGLERTGCMWCMFGIHLEKQPNRFQRMKITHPKQYHYCINKLQYDKILNYLGIEY